MWKRVGEERNQAQQVQTAIIIYCNHKRLNENSARCVESKLFKSACVWCTWDLVCITNRMENTASYPSSLDSHEICTLKVLSYNWNPRKPHDNVHHSNKYARFGFALHKNTIFINRYDRALCMKMRAFGYSVRTKCKGAALAFNGKQKAKFSIENGRWQMLGIWRKFNPPPSNHINVHS